MPTHNIRASGEYIYPINNCKRYKVNLVLIKYFILFAHAFFSFYQRNKPSVLSTTRARMNCAHAYTQHPRQWGVLSSCEYIYPINNCKRYKVYLILIKYFILFAHAFFSFYQRNKPSVLITTRARMNCAHAYTQHPRQWGVNELNRSVVTNLGQLGDFNFLSSIQ
jgi:hypothetical protein